MSESHIPQREQLVIRDALDRAIRILRKRSKRGLITSIAAATGTNENTTRAYLTGTRRPAVAFVRDLALFAGLPASELFVALGWLPAEEAIAPDPVRVAESLASLAATIGRLEPHVRSVLDTTLTSAPAPFAATAALLSDTDGASRFDVRMFKVVSGHRYRAITNGCAEFLLKPDEKPLDPPDLDALVRASGHPGPPPAVAPDDPDYWCVNLELRCRTYGALRDADLGQFTWQGEPGTQTWTDQAMRWPTHIITQDPFGGVAQPSRTDFWWSGQARTLVVIGARYSAALAAAALAEGLGWQFVPVRSDAEITPDGRLFPVAREQQSGRVQAWTSVAQHIMQRGRTGASWPAVVLLRPVALSGPTGIERYAVDLLRDTPASVVYVRPSASVLAWWSARQVRTSVTGQFDGDAWLSRTQAQLHTIESTLAARDQRGDLYLAPPAVEVPIQPGAEIPDAVMDTQAAIAWTTLQWLNDTANQGGPSLAARLQPGTLAAWAPRLATDAEASVPRLHLR